MTRQRNRLTRLDTLEVHARLRFARAEEEKVQQGARAAERLSATDRATVIELYEARDHDRAWWREVMEAGGANGSAHMEGGKAARDWARLTDTGIPGEMFPPAPAGSALYFGREAAQCEAALAFCLNPPAEYSPPGGVQLLALQTSVRWSAAWWRWMASLAHVIGEA